MLFAAVKLASPLLVSLALLLGSMGTAFGAEGLTMTNVTGAAGDCTRPASGGVCAALFGPGGVIAPGREVSRTVTIGYHGGRTTEEFGVYATDYVSRTAASALFCTAADPAGMLDLAIREGSGLVYQGTLAGFAADHSNPQTLLTVGGGHWKPGQSTTFIFTVSLDPGAGNEYMGCVSTAGLAWYAA